MGTFQPEVCFKKHADPIRPAFMIHADPVRPDHIPDTGCAKQPHRPENMDEDQLLSDGIESRLVNSDREHGREHQLKILEDMKYKLLGNTGLKVSELCLGAMTFGGRGTWTAIGTLPW